jgi:hypothetical protein
MCTHAFPLLAAWSIGLMAAQSAPAPQQSPEKAPAAPAAAKQPPAPGRANSLVVDLAPDGEGAAARLAVFAGADTSSVARMGDGRLVVAYQGFPADNPRESNRTAVRFSHDEGRSWTDATPIVVDGIDPTLAPPFDPAVVALPDGRLRLYFISYIASEMKPGTPPTTTAVYSAVSSDGLRYRFEPGVRFTVAGRVVVDAAAALHKGVFHIVVPDNGTAGEFLARRERGEAQPGGNGYHAVSGDGLVFERVADLALPSTSNRWWGNLLSDGEALFFFGTGPGPWPLASTDGMHWKPAEHPRTMPGVDPCAVRTRDRTLLLIATSAPAPAPRAAPAADPAKNQPGAR